MKAQGGSQAASVALTSGLADRAALLGAPQKLATLGLQLLLVQCTSPVGGRGQGRSER